ncbi:hypothetical protein [Amycolatopsis sp. H20-H5]|nr:hypothetical protein [Amycolatopsis sp. H20-H5]MEC3977374.1 hypothetical protein [Amycolatopsis sp. H20-H5]
MSGRNPVPWTVPLPALRQFVGRHEELLAEPPEEYLDTMFSPYSSE